MLNSYYSVIFADYTTYLESTELSTSTKEHYKRSAMIFMDYLTQTKTLQTGEIIMENCNAYLKTLTDIVLKLLNKISVVYVIF